MTAVLVPIAVALVAPLLTYAALRRKGSGRIATSDASELWKEANAMRKELRDEVAALRGQIVDVKKAEEECKASLAALHDELEDVKLRWGMP